ncbi:MAG: histidine phosphatase family protein [Antricoccus sp.]
MTDRIRTVVHLVRHGEVYNPTGVLYGRLPGFHLSDLGRQMAQRVADRFASNDITHLVASPLDRAQETAAPIGERLALPIHTDRRMIEADNLFEGTKVSFSKVSNWPKLRNPTRPSWGEPYVNIVRRVNAAVNDAYANARGHEAIIVSHQLPIWVARLAIEGERLWHDPRHRECALGSVTSVFFEGEKLARIAYEEPSGDVGSRVPGA